MIFHQRSAGIMLFQPTVFFRIIGVRWNNVYRWTGRAVTLWQPYNQKHSTKFVKIAR